MIRTRFAPSPTGDLHLGGAWTALASFALGGVRVLRLEDIDSPRVVAGSFERICEDLKWLGLSWDEGPDVGGACEPYVQSARTKIYEDAIVELTKKSLTYLCDCSRTEIAQVASAPHGGEAVYPGTCRDKAVHRKFRREPSVRLRIPEGATESFLDLGSGEGKITQHIDRDVGDFVLRRGDGIFSYQLAVAVDDAMMKISHVVRGRDLLSSTPRQILLMKLLGFEAIPAYVHLPLVVDALGERLAKRNQGATIRDLRERRIGAQEIVGKLAFGLGLAKQMTPITASDLSTMTNLLRDLSRVSWCPEARWLEPNVAD